MAPSSILMAVSDPFLEPKSSLLINIIGRRYGEPFLNSKPKAKMDDPSTVRKNKTTNYKETKNTQTSIDILKSGQRHSVSKS